MTDTAQACALDTHIKRLRKRVRLLMVERYGLFGASAGALAAAVVVLLSYRYDELLDYALWAGILAIGAVAGCAYGLWKRLDDLALAVAADARTDLKERLSTAVALGLSGDLREMERALINDAGERIGQFDPKEVFRHRFGLPHGACAAALVVLLGIILLPQFPALQSKTRRQEVAVMKKEGAKLSKLAKDLDSQTGSKHKELKKLANRLDKLAWKMQTGRLAKKKAMLQMQRLTKDIKEQQDKLAKENSGGKPMEQARREMLKAGDELARKMAQELAQKQNIPLSEAIKKLPSDKRLAELARKAGPLSRAEQHELEQKIGKYADPSNGLPVPSELGEALAKLAQNKDYQKAAEMMQKLAQKLGSGKMSQADKQALQKQLEQLAKALKGTDLDKLAKMMRQNAEKLAKMSPEELKQMMKQMQEMQKMAQHLAKAGGG